MSGSPFSDPRYAELGCNHHPGPASVAAHLAAVHDHLGTASGDATRCLCAASDDLALVQVDRNGLPMCLVLCRACGIIRQNPQPSSDTLAWFYTRHYRAIYGPHVAADSLYDAYAWKGQLAARVLGEAGVELADRTLLDVGCGGGWALRAVRAEGCTKIGYDFDEEFLAMGRSHRLDLRRGDAAQARADGVEADVLIAAHVLEHAKDPVGWLADLRPLARAGGHLYVEVPHFRRVRATLECDSRRYWQLAHLWDFQRAHVEAMARRAGWRPIHSTEDDQSVEVVCELAEPEPETPMPAMGTVVEDLLRHCEAMRTSMVYRARRAAYHRARRIKRALLGPRR